MLLVMGLLLTGAIGVRGQDKDNPSLQTTKIIGEIKGRILDYETQQPLAGVVVAVVDKEWQVQSDETGSYSLPEIPVGYYVLSFQVDGYYSDNRTDVIVRSGRITFLNVRMLAMRVINEEIRVTADYFPTTVNKPGSQMQFNAEDLRRNAGSAGDVSRALYNVPGVVKAEEEANDLIVRGGSPMENGFYIDNIFIPNINHFPQWGASGGNISMLNMDFIESLDVYTGGFDAAYGNRLSSIIDIGYREGNRERINSQLNLSIIGYGAQMEGPLPGKKGSWMLSATRSYLNLMRDITGGDIGRSGFGDVQGKLTYDLSPGNSLAFLTIVGNSYTKEPGNQEKFKNITIGLNWRHLWGDRGYSDTSVGYASIKGREEWWNDPDPELTYFEGYRQEWMSFRSVNHLQLSSVHQLKFGFEAQRINFKDDYFIERDVGEAIHGTSGAAFATYVVYPFHNFSLSSGLRLDYIPFSERTHFSPRFSFSWVLTKRLSMNGAYGMFYQQIPLFLMKQHRDNFDLKDPRARHLVLGFKYLLRQDTQLTLEVYDKQYAHFPMSLQNRFFLTIDDVSGDDARFGNWGELLALGKAYARGVELTLQKKLSKKLYGIVNLTYYRARYRDLMGIWRNRMYDNRFIASIYGGFKPNKNWEFNARLTLSGNRAFTPVNEQKSLQYGFPWVDYEDIMGGYLANYQNLSLRADRRFYFKKTYLVVFAGALNILDHQNELYRYWVPGINGYESEYMWGIIPYIGLEFEF